MLALRVRVTLARALVMEPNVLVMDEPLSNLDAKRRVQMRSEIRRIHKFLGLTIPEPPHSTNIAE